MTALRMRASRAAFLFAVCSVARGARPANVRRWRPPFAHPAPASPFPCVPAEANATFTRSPSRSRQRSLKTQNGQPEVSRPLERDRRDAGDEKGGRSAAGGNQASRGRKWRHAERIRTGAARVGTEGDRKTRSKGREKVQRGGSQVVPDGSEAKRKGAPARRHAQTAWHAAPLARPAAMPSASLAHRRRQKRLQRYEVESGGPYGAQYGSGPGVERQRGRPSGAGEVSWRGRVRTLERAKKRKTRCHAVEIPWEGERASPCVRDRMGGRGRTKRTGGAVVSTAEAGRG